MLDSMAERYGILPSELLQRADTFDLMVMDVALTYQKYINDKQQKKVDPDLMDNESLMDRLKRTRDK